MELTVIVPTFNEENLAKKTINSIKSTLRSSNLNWEILAVDDSTDNTYSILQGMSKNIKQLRVIHRANKKGVGSATRLGIKESRGKYIVVFMADAPDDAKYIPFILNKLRKGYDVVQTSRFMRGCKIVNYPFKKRVCNWLCNSFINFAFLNFRLRDFSSLFKGFRKEKVDKLNLEASEFDLGLEIILKAVRKRYKIAEVPVNWYEREKGKSKLKLSRYAKHYFSRVIKIWLGYW